MHPGMILIDLEKAFDKLDHKLLLENMTCLGIKTSVIKWFEFYLSSRKFFVFVDDIFSEAGTLNCGVSHQSVMGPLLVLIYIYDLRLSLSEKGSYFYADDKCIFYQGKDINKIGFY